MMQFKAPAPGEPSKASLILGYLRSRHFWLTLLAVLGACVVGFFLLEAGLRWYTNHGQRLQVGDYVEMDLADAERQIDKDDFRVQIIDSVYLIDKPPHVVLRQDPPAGSFVKENRRIYLTITKSVPDEVTLPALAGTYELERYQRKLSLLDISGTVRDREFNNKYQPNTILRVYYRGREISESDLRSGFRIPRGSTLEFTVTTKEGGRTELPNLMCRSLEEVRFLLENYQLRIGTIEEDASVTNAETAFVWMQEPLSIQGTTVPLGSTVNLWVTQERPAECLNE
jgi:Uncharacterized protein conserved in bacteria